MIVVVKILYCEIKYLQEWIEYHIKQGFTKFYIYIVYGELPFGTTLIKDDNIDIKIKSIINSFTNINIEYFHIEQTIRYIHIINFIKTISNNHIGEWCVILDIDEFINCPIKDQTIKDQIKFYENNNINNVFVNWLCFGSNDIIDNPDFKVIDKFTKPTNRFDACNFIGKSFFKIKKNLCSNKINNTHKFNNFGKYYSTNGNKFIDSNNKNKNKLILERTNYLNALNQTGMINSFNNNYIYFYPEENPKLIINHYITRSYNEYQDKIKLNKNRQDRYCLSFFNYINSA